MAVLSKKCYCSNAPKIVLFCFYSSTLDLRSRIGGKRKFSEDDEEDSFSEPETKKVMSVVKKVKKEKKEKKKKKDKERDRHSDSRKKTKKSKPSGSIGEYFNANFSFQ